MAINDGFQLTTIVAMPRGMTEDEAYAFLISGNLPNSENPSDVTLHSDIVTPAKPDQGLSEGDALRYLQGLPLSGE
jgi:hypothetical protein